MRQRAQRGEKRIEKRADKRMEKRTEIRPEEHAGQSPAELPAHLLAGRHAVMEAIKAGRGINRILLADGAHGGAVGELRDLARAHGITVDVVGRAKLDAAVPEGVRHQGILAYAAPVAYVSVEEIIADSDRDHWFSATEALDYGFIDHIVTSSREIGAQNGDN